VLRASVDLCAELGGSYLVHGSPAQRRVARSGDAARAEEAWILAAEQAATAKVTYCLEPLARPDCNFVNTLAEAADVVRRLANPALRIMVDTLAASLMEPEPVADAIRRWMPSGLLTHVQFNDRNRRGPGQGDDRFAPIVRALRETAYGGWIAMEPFVYEPDGPTCAARMIGYVSGLLESSV
jgi:sugar phosphate isomerase/epimerase